MATKPTIAPEVQQFLDEWLTDESGSEVIGWFLEDDLVDRAELKRILLKIATDYRADAANNTDEEEKAWLLEVAQKAENAAKTL